jgi:hypothetical protein
MAFMTADAANNKVVVQLKMSDAILSDAFID